MTSPLRHEPYPCSFGATTINDIRSVTVAPGVTHMVMTPGGNVIPSAYAMAFSEPVIDITTSDIATVLAAAGLTTGLSVSDAFEVQYEKRLAGGAFAGSGNHTTLNGTNGFLYVDSLSAEQDSAEGATLMAKFAALSTDGYTAPIAVNTSQSLAGTPGVPLRHALGPVYRGSGTQIQGVTSLKINSGLTVEMKRSDGGVFPVLCHVVKREPMIELSVLNPALIDEAALGPFISGLAGDGITAYLQAVAPGGGRAAGNSGTHISIAGATGVWQVTNQAGTQGQDVVTTIQAKLTANLSISTSANLPS